MQHLLKSMHASPTLVEYIYARLGKTSGDFAKSCTLSHIALILIFIRMMMTGKLIPAIFEAISVIVFIVVVVGMSVILERPKIFDLKNMKTKMFSGKPFIVITGANRGIGFQAAKSLAKIGCRVILGMSFLIILCLGLY
jgi:hypothetical protein